MPGESEGDMPWMAIDNCAPAGKLSKCNWPFRLCGDLRGHRQSPRARSVQAAASFGISMGEV